MKILKYNLIIAIFLLFSTTFAATGEHIANADLTIKTSSGKTYRCKTDANGHFVFPDLDDDCDGFTVSLNFSKIEWSWGTSNSGGRVSLLRESPTKSSTGVTSARTAAPRDVATGQASGKRQHKPFSYRATLCPNGDCSLGTCVLDIKSDGNTIQGMAINEKGLPGEKKPAKGTK